VLGFWYTTLSLNSCGIADEAFIHRRIEQSLAADGATAWLSSNLFPSARMLIARRS
jgi:hypothetical protein